MKPEQKRSGASQKKPQTTEDAVVAAAAASGVDKPRSASDGPSPAIWSRYIDSRMKQFGTR